MLHSPALDQVNRQTIAAKAWTPTSLKEKRPRRIQRLGREVESIILLRDHFFGDSEPLPSSLKIMNEPRLPPIWLAL